MGQPQGATPLLIAQGSRREEGTTWAVFLTKGDVDLLADPARPALLALQQPPGCPSTFLRALVRGSGGGGLPVLGSGREHPLQHKNHCLGSADPGARLLGKPCGLG